MSPSTNEADIVLSTHLEGSSPTFQSIRLSDARGADFSIIDGAVTDDRILLLASAEPNEWSTESSTFVVLSHDFHSGHESMRCLLGAGLNNSHGHGAVFTTPSRILLGANDVFVVVDGQGIGSLRAGSTKRQPVPFQISVFRLLGPDKAELLHLLDEPEGLGARLQEYDLAVSSVKCHEDLLVAVLRWRDGESHRQVSSGGPRMFMDGFDACEAIVWNLRTGRIVTRLPMSPIGMSRPDVKFASSDELEITCGPESTRYFSALDGRASVRQDDTVSLSTVDKALKRALYSDNTIPERSDLADCATFSASAVRCCTLPATGSARSTELQQRHIIDQSTALYSARDTPFTRLAENQDRFYLCKTGIAATLGGPHVYKLPLQDRPDIEGTPTPFLRALDESLAILVDGTRPLCSRPAFSRSRSTSAAHSRQTSISSLWSVGLSDNITNPSTPISEAGSEGAQDKVFIQFIPLKDTRTVGLLQQEKNWVHGDRVLAVIEGNLEIANVS